MKDTLTFPQNEESFIQLILRTYDALKNADDLSPLNPAINEALGYYVPAILAVDDRG